MVGGFILQNMQALSVLLYSNRFLSGGSKVFFFPPAIFRFFLFGLMFLFVVPAKLNIFDGLQTVAIAVAILSAFSLVSIIFFNRLSRGFCFVLFCFFISSIYSSVFPVLLGTYDFYVFKLIVLGGVFLMCALQLVFLYRLCCGDGFCNQILFDIFMICALNSFVAVLVLWSEAARIFFYNLFLTSELNLIHLSQGYRSAGLFFTGLSPMSVYNALCFLIGVLVIFSKNMSWRGSIILMLPLCVVVLSTFISGRLGVFFIFALSVCIFVFKFPEIKRLRVLFFLCFGFLCFVFLYSDDLHGILEWSLELFLNIYRSGEFESGSSSVLFNDMYFLPASTEEVVWGAGTFGRGDFNYINTDAGYLLMVFFGGVLGLPIICLGYISIFLVSILRKGDPKIKFALLFGLFFVFLGNFKDVYLYSSNGINQVIFILFSCLLISRGDLIVRR